MTWKEWLKNYPGMTREWLGNDSGMTQEWLGNESRMNQEWIRNYSKNSLGMTLEYKIGNESGMTYKWTTDDPQMAKKLTHYDSDSIPIALLDEILICLFSTWCIFRLRYLAHFLLMMKSFSPVVTSDALKIVPNSVVKHYCLWYEF